MSTVLPVSLTMFIYVNLLFYNGVMTLEQLFLSALSVDVYALFKAESCDTTMVHPWEAKFEAHRETILQFFRKFPILHISTSLNHSRKQPLTFTSKYHKMCSIAFHCHTQQPGSNNRLEILLWAASLPGGIFRSIHVVLTNASHSTHDKYNYFRHVVFLSLETYYYVPGTLVRSSLKLNWHLEPLVYVSWEGVKNVETFLQNGRWVEPGTPTMYFFAIFINASLTHNSQDVPQQRGAGEDGQWDAYLTPLLELSSTNHISAIRDPSSVPHRLVYSSRPVQYDSILFYTPLSVELPLNVAAALTYPFASDAWITICGVAALLIALQTVHRWVSTGGTKSFVSDAALATVKVLLEQPADIPKMTSFAAQIIVPWCIVALLLCTFYRSAFFGAFIKPEVLSPPKTLADLLATTRFHIHGVAFADDIEVLLKVITDNYSKGLLSRAQSEGYVPYDAILCCRFIGNGSGVCVGYESYLQYFVFSALHTLQGEPLFEVSKEFYSFPQAFVISCLFPHILESLSGFIQRLQPHGFYEVWQIRPDVSLTKLWHKTMEDNDMPIADIIRNSKSQAATWPLYASFLSLVGFGCMLGAISFLVECRI